MAKQKLPNDFKEFLKLLNDLDVQYLLVGGYAVAYHGYPRTTADMDLWIDKSPENAIKLVDAFQRFGMSDPNLTSDLFQERNKIIRMGVPPLRIEVHTDIDGLDFKECYPDRLNTVIDDQKVSLISLAHLRINKRASARHRDLDDLENLPD